MRSGFINSYLITAGFRLIGVVQIGQRFSSGGNLKKSHYLWQEAPESAPPETSIYLAENVKNFTRFCRSEPPM